MRYAIIRYDMVCCDMVCCPNVPAHLVNARCSACAATGTTYPIQRLRLAQRQGTQVCWTAPLNVVQGPVRTQFGYHLIEVLDRDPPPPPPADSPPAGVEFKPSAAAGGSRNLEKSD